MSSLTATGQRRKQMYKSGLSQGTTHRTNSAVQLRKAKRQKQLSSKRMKFTNTISTTTTTTTTTQPLHTPEELQTMVQNLVTTLSSNSSTTTLTTAIKQLRKLLSEITAHAPPITAIIQCNGVPVLINYLTSTSEEQRLEAAWCLSNIASGTHKQAQHVLPAVPYLVGFLTGTEPALREQSLWALGNLAGDGPEFRTVLHANGVLVPTAQVYTSTTSITTATTAAWALSNLAKGRDTSALPFLQANVLTSIVSYIENNSNNINNEQDAMNKRMLLIESCWLLAYIVAKEVECVHSILSTTNGTIVSVLCNQLIPLDEELARPVLRSLGNIFSAHGVNPSHLTVAMSSTTFIPSLLYFLQGGTPQSPCHRSLTKEAMWVVANIMTGTEEQQTYAENQGLITAVCALIPNASFDVRKEAATALFNTIAHGASDRTSRVLNANGVLETFVRMLTVPDQESVSVSLKLIEIACSCGKVNVLESVGCMDALENVIYQSESNELKTAASRLWDNYFDLPEEDEADGNDGGAMNINFGSMGAGTGGGGMFGSNNTDMLGSGFDNVNNNSGRGRGRMLPAWAQQNK